MKKIKKHYEGMKLNKFTLIALVAVFVLSIMIAVAVANNEDALSRNWFWAFAGVNCLGFGATLYVHGLVAKSNNLCILAGIILFALGSLWFVTDILYNGGAKNVVGSGWWIGLISAVVIGALGYFVPVFVNKNRK